MKKALALIVVVLACVPVAQGAGLPTRGVLTPGESLAGVRIGDTLAKVKRHWGSHYKVCPDCESRTWFYFYAHGEPLGAAVRFNDQGRVVAVFTLGAPTGWHTAEGLLVGEQIDKVARLYGTLGWHRCIGYGAMTMRKGNLVTGRSGRSKASCRSPSRRPGKRRCGAAPSTSATCPARQPRP